MVEWPVELGQLIVDPAAARPQQYVGVEVVVVLQTRRGAARRVCGGVAPDAEGAYPEYHPGLGGGYHVVYLLNEQVDVATAPVGQLHAFAVAAEGGAVVKAHALDGIGVEVVVEVYAVDIVAGHDIAHHRGDMVAVGRLAGVEVQSPVVPHRALGMAAGYVPGRHALAAGGRDAVGVEPGVQLHAAGVGLVDDKLQRVPCRRRRLASGTEIAAPWLEPRGIEGVGLRAHLEDDGVDAGGLQRVELRAQVCLVGGGGAAGIVVAVYGLEPRSAELAPLPGRGEHRQCGE